MTLSLWMTSSSSQKSSGPSYLGSPRQGWEMCRKKGLKTAWKDWREQGPGKNCPSEQGCRGSEEPGAPRERPVENGRGREGGAEGQRSTGLSRVLGMPISWLLAASEWHSRAVPQPSFLQLLEPRVISTSEKQRSRTCRTLGESRGARVLRGAGL